MAGHLPKEVTFIGLGQMGLPMAKRLLAAGATMKAYDIADEPVAAFVRAGGHGAASLRQACAGANIVITMLPDGRIVREALLGGDKAIVNAAAGALVIDMSSSAPFLTRLLGDELAQLGFQLIDAPVSGGVRRALDGSLSVMTGGNEADIARAMPLLEIMGKALFPVGPLGAGHAMKALNNYVSAAGLVAACEAVIVARSFGLAPETVVDILNVSTGRNNSTETKMKPFVLSGAFASGFSMALMAKDIGTAADLASQLGVRAGGIDTAARLWFSASGALGNAADHTAIYSYLESGEHSEGV